LGSSAHLAIQQLLLSSLFIMVRILANGQIVADTYTTTHVVYRRERCDSDSSDSSQSSCGQPEVIEPPLMIQHIDLSSNDISKVNGVSYFGVTFVDGNSGVRRRTMKRYSEFRELADDIEFKDDFPRKHLTSCTGDKLEKRRLNLEAWLRMALLHQGKFHDMRPSLREFLMDESQPAMEPMPAPVAPIPFTPSQAFTPYAPPLQVALPQNPAVAPAIVMMQVQIPEGTQPGQSLQVTVPDGRQVFVSIPQGYVGGMVAQFAFNSQDGSLTLCS